MPPPRRVTLEEVARSAGVSRATASFVLNGREGMRISGLTRDRVHRVATELGYRPNLMARSLRTRVTSMIALLSDTVATDEYAGQMVRGALAAASEREHLVVLGESQGDARLEANLTEGLVDRGMDGFVYAAMFTRVVAVPEALRRQPLVLLNCLADAGDFHSVVPDEEAAGRAVARAVVAAGHRDGITLVGETPRTSYAGHLRRTGIVGALAAQDVALASQVECRWWPEPAREAVQQLLRDSAEAPRVLVCLNDRTALGAFQALTAAGLRVPDDVSLVSFDDSSLATWMQPGLTSAALPHAAMGRLAVELLLAPASPPTVHRVAMPLRTRGSLGPPRAGQLY